MLTIIKILSVLFVWSQTSVAFGNTCESYMGQKVVTDHTVVTLTYGYTNTLEFPDALSPLELVQADRLVIDQIAGFLRQDESYIQRLDVDDVKVILQVFQRYENYATPFGFQEDDNLISLKAPEILTYAVLEFYNTFDPQRARTAINRIRGVKGESPGISPATQYRFSRILRHMISFYTEAGDFETVNRLINLLNTRHSNQ